MLVYLACCRKFLGFLLVATLLVPASSLAAAVLVFDDRQEEASLVGHVDRLRDPGGGLTRADVAFGSAAADFRVVQGDVGLGYTSAIRRTRCGCGFRSGGSRLAPAKSIFSSPRASCRSSTSIDAPAFFGHRPYVSIERVFALAVPPGETRIFHVRARTLGTGHCR